MIELGIMARTFIRPTLGETLDAIVAAGLHYVQFNLECAGLEELPEEIAPEDAAAIRQEFAARGLTMSAVSGTYNMIHPDPRARRDGLRRLQALAATCEQLGTGVITLCTGTRDPQNMWRRHPDNDTPAAWDALLEVMQEALATAARYHVTLGVEPEPANVVDRPAKARRLMDEMGSPWLKIVMDGANLFHAGDLARMPQVLGEAFALLGKDIVLAHAKDLTHDGEAGNVAAGKGKFDYDRYVALLQQAGYNGPLIMHGLAESELEGTVAFLRARLARLG